MTPGVRRKFCFDYREGDCLPHFCHGRDALKNTLKWFIKKLTPLFGKKTDMGQKIYDVDNKLEHVVRYYFLMNDHLLISFN